MSNLVAEPVDPPYCTAETTVRGLHAALAQMHAWCEARLSEMPEENRAAINQHMPAAELPDAEMLGVVAVWQNYRTVRAVRSVRIGFDWAKRELGPGHPEWDVTVGKLVIAGRNLIKHAANMPSDFRAVRQRQLNTFMNFMRQANGEDGAQQAG